ncbi:MAG: DUF4834 family protein [Prevotellaceae bacterium]|nr:DUF4834 family protein [Prevotellaceae bacterium]
MKILFTILFFMVLFGYIFRLLLPYIMRWLMKRMGRKITEQFHNTTAKQTKREGQVIIKQTDKKEKKVDKGIGDYIDFEEEN